MKIRLDFKPLNVFLFLIAFNLILFGQHFLHKDVISIDDSGNLWVKANILTNTTVTFDEEYNNGNSGATATIAMDNGQKQKITLTDNCTFTLTAPTSGIGNFLLRVIQDAGGTNVITWPTVYAPDDDSDGDGDLNPDTDGNTICIYNLYYNDTSWFIVLANDFHEYVAD